jgi:TolA-binding protein
MKRSERHHLKENEVSVSVARAWELATENRQQVIAGGLLVAVIVAALAGFLWWRQRVDSESRTLLADALAVADAPVAPPAVPGPDGKIPPPQPGSFVSEQAKLQALLPKLDAVAAKYPSTPAGLTARYKAAATLVGMGRPADAIPKYQAVIAKAGEGVYGVMARLGLAEAQQAAGQADAAIATYREVLDKRSDGMPTDAVLMELGRACASAGKTADAKQAFKRITDEFPQSAYAPLAKRELDKLGSVTVAQK